MPKYRASTPSGAGIRSLSGSTGASDAGACLCRNEKAKQEKMIVQTIWLLFPHCPM